MVDVRSESSVQGEVPRTSQWVDLTYSGLMKSLTRRLGPLCLMPLLLVQGAGAQQAPATPQTGATFRAGVDLVRVGVQVYDKNHHVVRGLTADDFDVRVDDATESIAAFSEIDTPPPATGSGADWTRDAAPDVASNEGADRESRLWAIIMDDCSTNDAVTAAVPFMVPNAKALGHAVVDAIAPGDRAAVIFSFQGKNAQDFTSSRAKLHAAVDTFTSSPQSAVCRSQDTIRSVATFLQQLANPRAAIVYIGLPPTWGARASMPTIPLLTRTPFYGFNVAGIITGPASADPVRQKTLTRQMILAGETRLRYEFLRTLTDAFGGVAMPDTNEPVRELPRVFADLDVTYVLGYRPTYPPTDGRYRRLRIRVKRAGLSVEPSDRMFKTEKGVDASKPIARWASLTNALSGVLPDADAPLTVNVLPIAAGVSKGESSVVIVIGARVPAGSTNSEQSLDILSVIFDGEGRNTISSQTSHAEVPGAATERAYDFLSLQSLKPGRYNLRFALQDNAAHTVGSVYTDVTVPDFAKELLSGMFWSFHDRLYADQTHLDAAALRLNATAIGISNFDQCIKDVNPGSRVNSDEQSARSIGIVGTPTFLIGVPENDGRVRVKRVSTGIQSEKTLGQLVDDVRRAARASLVSSNDGS